MSKILETKGHTLSKWIEKLSLSQIKQHDFFTGKDNNHLSIFIKQRQALNGNNVSQCRLITTEINNKGWATFLFEIESTKDENAKKEITTDFKVIDNKTGKYTIELCIADFWDKIDEFKLVNTNDFTGKDLMALINLSEDIKMWCNCPSFNFMTANYYLSTKHASLNPTNIAPKKWNDPKLRGQSMVCKHTSFLLKNLAFYVPQMAMSVRRELIKQDFITDYK